MKNLKKIVFKNGLRLLLVRQPASLAASVLILVEAGSEYETKRVNGVSHFLEHLAFKGTANRPKPGMIAEELAALGAQTNAFTSQEYTGYWAKAEARKLPDILEIISDLYLNPIFNPEEIEKERGVIIEELNMYEDTPARKVQDIFLSLLYGDQPAGWDVGGEKHIVKKIGRKDVVAYRDARYVAKGTVVVAAGMFSEKAVVKQVNKYFAGLPPRTAKKKGKTTERQKKPGVLVRFKESGQSHLVLGVRAFDLFDKRRYALQVLADILGGGMSSRLWKRVREELGAAYYVNAGTDLSLDHGFLSIAAGVDHAKIETVIRAVLEELRRIRTDLVPPKELRKAKDQMISSLILDLETSDELAGFYGGQEILTKSLLPPATLIDRIEKVTAEQVRSAAKTVFKNSGLNLAVIGPYKTQAMFKKILTL